MKARPDLVIAALGALSLAGCEQSSKKPASAPAKPPIVTVVEVVQKKVPVSMRFSGTVKPVKAIEVIPRVGGFIEKRLYVEGSDLKAGDEMYLIDPRTYEATLEGAKAGSTKKEWLLTAGNAKAHDTDVWDWGRSDEIALNGAVLKLSATGDAPPMAPKETAATQPVAIAPLSVALLQYTPAAGAKACVGSHTSVPSKTDDDAGTL